MRLFKTCLALATSLLIAGCAPQPTPVTDTVTNLDAEAYMGTWYEILRLPNSFQEGLHQVTAEYRLNEDGTFEVTNRGYNREKGQWSTAVGKASPVEDMPGSFTVQFQWPFSGGYNVVELGEDYEYAIVISNDHDYFWLLARSPNAPRWLIDQTLAKASSWGFDIDAMIETRH
ncbi:hypothetical protein CWE09_13520 [Aliidiomarina minuta]|uniref:Outer membrane lipoprotein Blc n=1 Tax=Aliidiomarina minuta TaxID=880057 RepID=A0A432W188_9GAMM|nr:lipocalin family protein [Aliidiomarina minuta]RUO22948.1 hypothetical protein CWE09_13520 [Aliidiomarina minuta]